MKIKFNQFLVSSLFISGSLFAKEAPPSLESLNIVISLSFGGRSHIKYLMEISKLLRDRGHSITYAAPESEHRFNDPYGYKIYNLGKSSMPDDKVTMQNTDTDHLLQMGIEYLPKYFKDIIINNYGDFFNSYEKLFKEQKIDLIICDFFSGPCHDGARKHSIPLIIGFQSLGFGITDAPYITYTLDTSPTTTETLSFFQRFRHAVIDPIYYIYKFSPLSKAANEARKKYGIPYNIDPWGAFDQAMKISNTYIGFDDARPIHSTLKLVGPVIDNEAPPLERELQEFLDNHRSLYIAFGSNVALNTRIITSLLETAQLSINNGAIDGVLWGLANTNSEKFPKSYTVNGETYSTDDILNGKHQKIKILNWAPQLSILNHSNTKLFISHGGVESTFESINSGTPILVMPIYGDQPRNSRLIKNRGIGDFVDTLTTNSTELFNKIKELTSSDNIEIQNNVKQIQSISRFNNGKRLENALFIEHYANTAKLCRKSQPAKSFEIPCELEPYMQADSRMPFISAYRIDILLALFTIGFTIAFTTLFIVYRLIKFFVQIPKIPKKKKD